MTNNSALPIVTRAQVAGIVDDNFHAIYKALQDLLGVTDGGEAGVFHGGDADDLQNEVVSHFMAYIDHERLVGPKKLEGDELVDARFDAVGYLVKVYDVSYWSASPGCSSWTVSGYHTDNDKWFVHLGLMDSSHVLEMTVLFAPDTADIIDVSIPDTLLHVRFEEANEALISYSFDSLGGIYEGKEFFSHSRDEVKADLILGWNDEVSHTMTVEFKPRTTEIIHIDVRAVDEAEGAFCD